MWQGVGRAYFSMTFISSFHKYLLSTYWVPGTVLGTVHAAINKRGQPEPIE